MSAEPQSIATPVSGQANRAMSIVFNGQPRALAEDANVAQLIAELGLPAKYVAVEVNLQLVPRAQHQQHRLCAGDRVEVVTLVGGG